MTDSDTGQDPQKRYWWLILVVLPLLLALIALIPDLINKEEPDKTVKNPTSIQNQHAQEVEQTTQNGHNFTNVQGNITITGSVLISM